MHRNTYYIRTTLALLSFLLAAVRVGASDNNLQLRPLIDHALKQNFDIQIADLEKQLGRLNVDAKRALYDTITNAMANHTIDRQEPPVPVFGTENDTTNLELSIEKVFPYGTAAALKWATQRLETNSTFSTTNPTFESSLQASLTQPLLQNFLGRNPRLTIDVAKLEDEILQLQIEDQIETTISRLINAYWLLAWQQQRLKYTEDALSFAQQVLAFNRKNRQLGLAEKSDALAAEANVSVRQQNLLEARLTYQRASLELAQLANVPKRLDYIAAEPLAQTMPLPDRSNTLSAAMLSRRDLQILRKQLQNSNTLVSISKNQLWPSLDLSLSFTLNGLDGGFGGAQEEFFTEDNTTFFIGGLFTYNWTNREQRSELQRNKIEKAQRLLRMKDAEATIVYDVERALLEIETQLNLLRQTEKVVTLQERKLTEEERRVRQGRSSTPLLVDNQDDLLEAQQAYLVAAYNYHVAVDGLRRIQNNLLEHYTEPGSL